MIKLNIKHKRNHQRVYDRNVGKLAIWTRLMLLWWMLLLYGLLDSLVVEYWHRVTEVPGLIPSQRPRHIKDDIKMVAEFPCLTLNIKKGKYWLFLKNYDRKINVINKIWDRSYSHRTYNWFSAICHSNVRCTSVHFVLNIVWKCLRNNDQW